MNITIKGGVPAGATETFWDVENDCLSARPRDYLLLSDLHFYDEKDNEVFMDRENWVNFGISQISPQGDAMTVAITMLFNVSSVEVGPAPLIIKNGAVASRSNLATS